MMIARLKTLIDRTIFWGGATSFTVAAIGTLWPL
ncbi:hypothetical protein EV657_10920 [Rhodovulum visakhapatnamense]|uniref:Uncharacterized protein n=1 Tax=Rhodovulum visakhapatnamense TaxID=364297 RepID=A0A4V3GU68_9RHOB|nr:hypothetical protein EV657_10920 [Rhodovulum visakhapatnamense]